MILTTASDETALLSQESIKRAARTVVDSAINGDFPIDPVIGQELSRAFSTVNSVVKRHGLLLQHGLGQALAASGRFDVMHEVPMPITEAAHELLTSENSARDLARIQLKSDANVLRMITVDLIVIDNESHWAGAYDVKRGNGATESRKRRPIEHDLRAARLVLASFLEKHGYEDIRKVTTGVIDYYGGSGFNKDIKLTKEQLDDHFGVPVLATVEAMTEELQKVLHSEMRKLLAPALKHLPRGESESLGDNIVAHPAMDAAERKNQSYSVSRALSARPTGPGPWRSRTA